MESEKEYVVRTFLESYKPYKAKKIILYGTGRNTEAIIKSAHDYHITGIMDPEKTGELFGKRILTFQEAKDADIIVIVAHYGVHNIIYQRIKKFADTCHIAVCDIYGRQISHDQTDYVEDSPYFNVDEKALLLKIKENEIISFDLFDTLVIRKIWHPQDVFALVERTWNQKKECEIPFARERRLVELELLKTGNPTIFEIYKKLAEKLSLTEAEREELLRLEIDTDKKLLVPRRKMVDILQEALKLGKQVYLITDMYYTREIIEEITSQCGISGYRDIYISCERGASKLQDLHLIYAREVGLHRRRLHIGDNYYADIEAVEKAGGSGFQIFSPLSMMEISRFRVISQKIVTLEDRIMGGMFLAEVFQNPFILYHSKGRCPVCSAEAAGYLFLAPMVWAFMLWFQSEVKALNCDYILFAARDGYLMEKIYRLMKLQPWGEGLPEEAYFLTSRKAAAAAVAEDEQDVYDVADLSFATSKNELLCNQFAFRPEELSGADIYIDSECRNQVLAGEMTQILQHTQQNRKNYETYITSLKLDQYHRIAITDCVGRGTQQYFLQRMLKEDVIGFYVCKWKWIPPRQRERYHYRTFYDETVSGGYEKGKNISHFYLFIEMMFKAPKPMVMGFTETGHPIYSENQMEENALLTVGNIQEGILRYVRDVLSLGLVWDSARCSRELYDTLLGCMAEKYCRHMDETIGELVFFDDWAGHVQKVGEQIKC